MANACIVHVRLLVHSKEIVKCTRKEMVMVGIHKTSNEKGISVKNVKDIQFVEQGRRMSKMVCSTNDSNYAILQKKESV